MGGAGEQITVRRGRREDAAALAALHREHAWCYDEANIVAEYYDDDFEPDTVIAAEVGGELVGKIELFLGWKSTVERYPQSRHRAILVTRKCGLARRA